MVRRHNKDSVVQETGDASHNRRRELPHFPQLRGYISDSDTTATRLSGRYLTQRQDTASRRVGAAVIKNGTQPDCYLPRLRF